MLVHRTAEQIRDEIERLEPLAQELCGAKVKDRHAVLDQNQEVKSYFGKPNPLTVLLPKLDEVEQLIVKELIAIGQVNHLLGFQGKEEEFFRNLQGVMEDLVPVERFYEDLGGIVGYHAMMLRFLIEGDGWDRRNGREFHRAPHLEIFEEKGEVRKYTVEGIRGLDRVAFMYPVGGAADRLNLRDEKTDEPLPAGLLHFNGRSLLEGLVCDLQAKEYLYYKLFGKQLTTPICLMTSKEKDNDARIKEMCEGNRWFDRPKESFHLFCQPLVPTIDREGNWGMGAPMQLLMKPGGHGVIWKLAQEAGIFEWLREEGRQKLVLRQINNPVAGIDYGLLCFIGYGVAEGKKFGFASCPRKVEANEGMNVLIEKKSAGKYEYCVTNIEYCDFEKYHIKDEPEAPGGKYSKFTSNTNILFTDVESVDQKVQEEPIPGMILNFKKALCFVDEGRLEERDIARLESTMQNIADYFVDEFDHPLEKGEDLQTYVTYNNRMKTIATTKKELPENRSLLETPEGCFLECMGNAYDLLTNSCGISVPKLNEGDDYLLYGPNFIFSYHPALGPLYSVIGQKLRHGKFGLRSEVRLEIAELDCENLAVEGSLHIFAKEVMGHVEEGRGLSYSEECGKCTLKNVVIRNEGIEHTVSNVYWKNEVQRLERCLILVEGNGEFVAENVTFSGDVEITVPAGYRMIARQEGEKVAFSMEKIEKPSWRWNYEISPNNRIQLNKAVS